MPRTPEQEKGKKFFITPGRSWVRKRIRNVQKSGPFKEFTNRLEPEKEPQQQKSDFTPADLKTIYKVNGSTKVRGDQFAEGVLPANAIPIGKATFFSKLFSKFRSFFQGK